ncbi:pentapeptide repeat-containing protein [Candidatus Arsenophonus triatominarum]|uniref:pentapeptide repeat-containing protein n=1 Tax=Candidatus Arsenophonus triatominarum TaxID=57911 RepID=UPI0007C44E22|nr:pentapeptide repeat-containing protein [Candidatus Arsenophonus triatominarum]
MVASITAIMVHKLIPFKLRERLYKMRIEGLSGRWALDAINAFEANDIVEKLRSELSIEERQTLFNRLFALKHENLKEFSAALINLEEINMHNMQLPQIEIIHSYLNNINATNSNLQNANLSHSEFKNSILRNVKLQKAKLIGVNFKNAVLEGANLQEADLTESILKKAKLNDANLESAVLKNANLRKAVLKNANLKSANLEKTDLSEANLEYVNFENANLEKADTQYALMSYASLEGANLKDAILAYSDLDNVDFTEATLDEAILNYCKLDNAKFDGAALNNAEINDASLIGVSFFGATLDGTSISFKLPNEWNENTLDTYINHITNENTGSILTTLGSIDDEYFNLKIELANDLINSLRKANANITSVAEPLIDVLSKEVYQTDRNIFNFMQEVCHGYFSRYNTNILLKPRESVLNAAINFFNRDLSLTTSGEFNAAFIQCIQDAIDIPEMKEKAIGLYNGYLSQAQIRPLLTRETDLKSFFGNYSGQPDWSDIDSNNYILLSPVNNQRSMMLSSSNLDKMRNPKETISWGNFYLFDNGNILPIGNLNFEDIFKAQFPLFSGPYAYSLRSVRFKNLLDLLDLGGELNQKFLLALNQRIITNVNDKMVSNVKQTQLSEIFNEKLDFDENSNPFLKLEHYNEILGVYNLTCDSEQEKAKSFLSLSAVFSRYSSSEVFGTELDSPLALRYYSSALMRKAHELSSAVFIGGRDNVDQFVDWNNRLLGMGGSFSCTAILSNMMIEHAKAKFPGVINSLLSPAWS